MLFFRLRYFTQPVSLSLALIPFAVGAAIYPSHYRIIKWLNRDRVRRWNKYPHGHSSAKYQFSHFSTLRISPIFVFFLSSVPFVSSVIFVLCHSLIRSLTSSIVVHPSIILSSALSESGHQMNVIRPIDEWIELGPFQWCRRRWIDCELCGVRFFFLGLLRTSFFASSKIYFCSEKKCIHLNSRFAIRNGRITKYGDGQRQKKQKLFLFIAKMSTNYKRNMRHKCASINIFRRRAMHALQLQASA